MIKVGHTPPISSGSRTEKKRKSSNSDAPAFTGFLSSAASAADSGAPASVEAPPSINNINPMLDLQEISDAELDRKKLLRHGQLTLETLDDLRIALLTGSLPTRILEQLETLVEQQRQHCEDPALKNILDDIELRAAVELAKIQQSNPRQGSSDATLNHHSPAV